MFGRVWAADCVEARVAIVDGGAGRRLPLVPGVSSGRWWWFSPCPPSPPNLTFSQYKFSITGPLGNKTIQTIPTVPPIPTIRTVVSLVLNHQVGPLSGNIFLDTPHFFFGYSYSENKTCSETSMARALKWRVYKVEKVMGSCLKSHVFESWFKNMTFSSWPHDLVHFVPLSFESPCHAFVLFSL